MKNINRGGLSMFCNKCGTQLLDESIFCSKCGANVAGTVSPSVIESPSVPVDLSTPSKGKTGKRRFLEVLIVFIVLITGVLGYECFFNKEVNYIQATYEAIKNISQLSEFDFELTIDGQAISSGSIRLGKDVKSSVMDITIGSGYDEQRFAVVNGDFAQTSYIYSDIYRSALGSQWYDSNDLRDMREYLGDELYERAYLYQENVCGLLAKTVKDGVGISIDFNKFVSDGHFNFKAINEAIDEAVESATKAAGGMASPQLNFSDEEFDEYLEKQQFRAIANFAKTWKEYLDIAGGPVMENFFTQECDNSMVFVDFFQRSTNKGLTTYSFSVDVKRFLHEFKKYVDTGVKKGKKEFDNELWQVFSELDEDDIDYMDDINIDFDVTVDKNNVLHSITLHSMTIEGDKIPQIVYTIKNHNKSAVDIDELEDFIQEAKLNSGGQY